MKKTILIGWVRRDQRAELLAQEIGTRPRYIIHGQQGKLWQAPFRYPAQAWRTWRLLRRERPDVVYVLNPPIFAPLVVFLYARLHGIGYVLDSSTGAFITPRWRWSVGIQRFLARRALLLIVHNRAQAEIVKDWGCRYLVLGFPAGRYPAGGEFAFSRRQNIAVVSTYELDEPLDVVFDAARLLPDVDFYVTGDSRRADATLLAHKPDNCHLTGFVPYEQYVGLLRGADAVLDLTTRNHTVLSGGFEAVSLETPLITSDWPILRETFARGTVHVPNTVEGVREGVLYALRHQAELRREITGLKQLLEAESARTSAELWSLVNSNERTRAHAEQTS